MSAKWWLVVRATLTVVGVVVLVVGLMLWLMGVFHPKIDLEARAGNGPGAVGARPVAEVIAETVPVTETAVGTVRAVHEASVASELLAKVTEVNVRAGSKVARGDVLVRLQDEDLQARVRQARANLEAAETARDQAKVEFGRVAELFEQKSAARIEYDRAEAALRSAEAQVAAAEQALRHAETILGYATIRSPIDGIVVDRRVEPGDTASPGQVLATLYDPTRMQLVARVRESLAHRLKVDQLITVRVDALGHDCEGVVSEIVPEAETSSRSFTVKVTGPCPPGVYAGMFGRLVIPMGEQPVLTVPRAAVRRIGQLDVVEVVEDGQLSRRAVRVGRSLDDRVIVLSGLRAGERVVLPEGIPGVVPAGVSGA